MSKKGRYDMPEEGQSPAGERDQSGGVNLRETARQLQMSVTTVNRWAKNGWIASTMDASGERLFDRLPAVAVLPQIGDAE
jgi:hypothetical protein